jgi:hypothetical protein
MAATPFRSIRQLLSADRADGTSGRKHRLRVADLLS